MAEKKEFRWEYKEIGQGHYYIDIKKCIDDAVEASLKRLDLTVKVEMFRPKRVLLATMEPVVKKPRMFQLENAQSGEKDGPPFEAESLQEAQAKILYQNGLYIREVK